MSAQDLWLARKVVRADGAGSMLCEIVDRTPERYRMLIGQIEQELTKNIQKYI